MKKNVIGRLLLTCTIIGSICSNYSIADAAGSINNATDGYFWMEAETDNFDTNLTEEYDNDGLSGGSGLSINAKDKDTYYIDFKVNVTESNTYKIYLRANYASGSTVKCVFDGEIKTLENINGTSTECGDYSVAWSVFSTDISAGEHVIRCYVDEAVSRKYRMGIDCLCVIPDNWRWSPDIENRPKAPEVKKVNNEGYYWLEAEADSWASNISTEYTDNKFSNEKGLSINTPKDSTVGGYYDDFKINVETEGSYVLYVRATANDYVWNSKAKCLIDGEEQALTIVGDSEYDSANRYKMGWTTVDVYLTEGNHVIKYIFEDKREGSGTSVNDLFYGAIDFVCLIPSKWSWNPNLTDKPKAPPCALWLEAEDAACKGLSTAKAAYENDVKIDEDTTKKVSYMSNNTWMILNNPTAPDKNGYYASFDLSLSKLSDYDIYIHGSIKDTWMSYPELVVDGRKIDTSVLMDESQRADTHYPVGWLKTVEAVPMDEGKHNIKWLINSSRESGTEHYIAAVDSLVIVPKGTKFEPVAKNVLESQKNFELSTLLSEIDAAKVIKDIKLPAKTLNGNIVTWVSSNEDVISHDGEIIRTDKDRKAILTATVTDSKTGDLISEKTYTVTVTKKTGIDIEGIWLLGNPEAGSNISAKTKIYVDGGNRDTVLFTGIYNSENKLLSYDIDYLSGNEIDMSTNLNIPVDIEKDSYIRTYLWEKANGFKPLIKYLEETIN